MTRIKLPPKDLREWKDGFTFRYRLAIDPDSGEVLLQYFCRLNPPFKRGQWLWATSGPARLKYALGAILWEIERDRRKTAKGKRSAQDQVDVWKSRTEVQD